MNNKKAFIASLIYFLLFLILAFLVIKDKVRDIDIFVTRTLQVLFPSSVDIPFSFTTWFASNEAGLILISLIFIGIFLLKRKLFFGLWTYFLVYIIEIIGKTHIFHMHPHSLFSRYAFEFHAPSSYIVRFHFSFPSGHMARAAFLGLIIIWISYLIRKRKPLLSLILRNASFLYIFLVFISRIYLGEHWLSDVLGGLLLGFSMASLAIAIL